MEIRDNRVLGAKTPLGAKEPDRNMSQKNKPSSRIDKADISHKISADAKSEPVLRSEKVEAARENIVRGRYNDPKVVDTIVNRLMDLFGI